MVMGTIGIPWDSHEKGNQSGYITEMGTGVELGHAHYFRTSLHVVGACCVSIYM